MDMNFKYCRVQGKELAANTKEPKGVFSILHQMAAGGVMEQEAADLFKEIDAWFADVLPWPPQCKNQENVICYFKTENSKMMMNMVRPMLWLMEKYKHPYYVVYTNSPGEIVYEDEYQVAVKAGDLVIEDVQASWSPKE
ncbi:MAG: hypothetical protein J5700_01660 [Treponema sp.]|nr:hypothetical protein [Treponema sp.]